MSKEMLYRIHFVNNESIYEIYVRKIQESEIFGFLEVEDFVFGENSTLVVDPSEERLKLEFNGVKRTYIPLHAVLRIDVVKKQGVAKVRDKLNNDDKISMFPVSNTRKKD